ncbi:glycosyl transferase family 2 [Candidatus Moduliflexus flocculans]|uniref:Glycosyl transferase family 2 n=1 Tax=Candidatus Moduliflexus flocculans TaxID=1499966 RepID=A0A0S6VQC2_9BACT|nr:glycosyl transferase family 2 [Candidatus Moduliflexus flocculans]
MSEILKKRLLIFIVAYNAERHIQHVLDRIPPSIYQDYEYEILLIDDSSTDHTFDFAKRYQSIHRDIRLKVLFNPENLGYGGNQKLGYHYAIQHHFDVVVLLHGDGQYAPELLEAMVSPIFDGEADIVLGSRMLNKGGARKGGMPLYKFIGNKMLTTFQNMLLKTSLSEFHSGYRAFSVKALRGLPFERNSNDFHFDTQILIQAAFKSLRILEIPIPTYYGDEICHVQGVKYAWNVFKSTLLAKAHTYSIFYQREYDLNPNEPAHYSLKSGYASSHSLAIERIAPHSTVLDLGCHQGYVANELRKKGCHVVGVDTLPATHSDYLNEFWLADLNHPDRLPSLEQFDHILMLDILQHLDNPEQFLDSIRKKTKRTSPVVIITTANVAFFIIRIQLLLAQFNYSKQGILDMTHKRLFTFHSLKKLCLGSGYKILSVKGIPAPFPKALGNNRFARFLVKVNEALIRVSKTLFSFQIYIEARPTPVVSELLAYAIHESVERKVISQETATEQTGEQ